MFIDSKKLLHRNFLIRKIQLLLIKSEKYRTDFINPFCIFILSVIGVFAIYSAQSYISGNRWKTQIFALILGYTIYFAMGFINYKIYLEKAHIIYILCIMLLVLIWSPLGHGNHSCNRWLKFKFFTVQPSDFAKIGTLIMASSILARSEITSVSQSIEILIKIGITFLIPIVLIFLQPDLGSSLIFPPMLFALLYVSKLSKRFFAFIFSGFVIILGLVSVDIIGYHHFLKKQDLTPTSQLGIYESHSYFPLKDYQRNRILSFVAPELVDPHGTGISWNLRQSLIAIGSGGFFGKGFNKGTQAKLGYLPQSVAPTDFIFSVYAEETGLTGGLLVIGLYSLLIGNTLRIASLARDRFGMLLAIGVSIIFVIHIFINIGMTIGIMPITGLPLPFLSYGGSFVLSCCILLGLIQSVYRSRKDFS